MTLDSVDANAPAPRLCHLTRWANFDGYGFNLHSDKTKTGQLIGKVDAGSPAEAAGLKKGDRIVEVNGVNIANENHKQVVERIKAVQTETRLLVVDEEADAWYKEHKIVIRGSLKNVIYLESPVTNPSSSKTPEVTANELADKIDPPIIIPAVSNHERRQSVQSSNDPPSKSGSLHTATPPPLRKRSSISSADSHTDSSTVKSASADHQPTLNSDTELSGRLNELPKHDIPDSNSAMKEQYQESTTSVDVHGSKDELASKLVGFRSVDHDTENTPPPPIPVREIPALPAELRSSLAGVNHSHERDHDVPAIGHQVHFSPSTAGSLDQVEVEERNAGRQMDIPDTGRAAAHQRSPLLDQSSSEYILPKSVGAISNNGTVDPKLPSPVLERPDSGAVREELFEEVERHQVDNRSSVDKSLTSVTETSRHAKGSDNSDSSSNSSRSMETGSYNMGKTDDSKQNTDDFGFGSKTPSPSPAVVPESYHPGMGPAVVMNSLRALSSADNVRDATVPEKIAPPAVAVKPSTPAASKPAANFGGLTLNVTAQEMREKLARQRKTDPRTQAIDMRKKYDLVNNM